MTRIPMVLLFLSSCSAISYSELPGLVKDSVFGVDFEVTNEFYDSQPYSFAKIKVGRSIVAITVLVKVQNGTYTWISQDGERIYTRDGKIIETDGLAHDIKILDSNNLKPIPFTEFTSNTMKYQEILLQLDRPHAIVSHFLSFSEVGVDSSYFNTMLYKEAFDSGKLAWKKDNLYWVDTEGRVIKTEQYIHPKMPKITMEFYYK